VTDLSMGILLRQTKLLRVLHVSGFKVGDKSMRHVASSCPHLEELHIILQTSEILKSGPLCRSHERYLVCVTKCDYAAMSPCGVL